MPQHQSVDAHAGVASHVACEVTLIWMLPVLARAIRMRAHRMSVLFESMQPRKPFDFHCRVPFLPEWQMLLWTYWHTNSCFMVSCTLRQHRHALRVHSSSRWQSATCSSAAMGCVQGAPSSLSSRCQTSQTGMKMCDCGCAMLTGRRC